MVEHVLKCWPIEFAAVRSGAKPFEFRKDDRGYNVGDILRLREYDPFADHYSGEEELRAVTYVLRSWFSLPAGYVVLGLAPAPRWQPVETAPTDGRDLLLTSPDWNGDVMVGSFAFGEWRQNSSPEACVFTPTLWMPIPAIEGIRALTTSEGSE